MDNRHVSSHGDSGDIAHIVDHRKFRQLLTRKEAEISKVKRAINAQCFHIAKTEQDLHIAKTPHFVQKRINALSATTKLMESKLKQHDEEISSIGHKYKKIDGRVQQERSRLNRQRKEYEEWTENRRSVLDQV